MAKIKEYYELAKSGLVLGNIITVIAGFLLGASGSARAINLWLLMATIVGIALVMASGCVFNNYIDRDIDVLMERTRRRALVAGLISGTGALIFATVLGVAGFLTLGIFTNLAAAAAAAVGFIFYVGVYTLWAKRRSTYGTFAGAFAGATPPVVGYAAATGRIDAAALILFIIMLVWQMPHFFAIAIRREEDYAAAKIPVMPVAHGIARTKTSMLIYIVEFIFAVSLLFTFGYAGYVYLGIVLVLSIAWFALGIQGLWISDAAGNTQWARRMFFLSLIVMIGVFGAIAIGALVR
jgi:heme o synthase